MVRGGYLPVRGERMAWRYDDYKYGNREECII